MLFHSEHLMAAWLRVQSGSQAAGVDGITPELFSGVAEQELSDLKRQLQAERYAAQPARGFTLAKSSGGHRTIGIPTVRDRIVQRYLLQAIYPRLEMTFSDCVFAYRPGYSVHSAISRVMEVYRHANAWVVKADIQKFFDNLIWPLLLNQLEELQLPALVVQAIAQQLQSGMVVGGQFRAMTKGVLQGSALSGALANLYLHEFDSQCLDAGIYLIRYGDDCVALCPSWIHAHRALGLMDGWLADLYLNLHPDKTRVIAPAEEFTFLGHRFGDGQVQLPDWRTRARPPSKSKKKIPARAGPPKACSIVKRPRGGRSKRTDDIWRDGMTTLYVTDQGAYLRVQSQQFQVLHQRELRCSVPVNRVSHIVLFGTCNLSHGAVSLALRRRIPVMYLASNGRYFGRLDTEGHAEIDYLTQQVVRSQDEGFKLRQSASIIAAKLHNSRVVLKRLYRKRKTEAAEQAISEIPNLQQKVMAAESVESMLGFEGQGAHLYFQAYASLLRGEFEFNKRTRRPPTDPVNSLLSLGYTLLSQNLHSMVEAVGLHTHFGNLHQARKNRPSLVCDLVEEFRAPVVDALAAYIVNKHILQANDFTEPDERGGVYLQPHALKTFLKQWEERLQQSIVHPHTGNKVSYRRCFELQVWEYVKCLMGEQEEYRPMTWAK